jgi:hypothetical protein
MPRADWRRFAVGDEALHGVARKRRNAHRLRSTFGDRAAHPADGRRLSDVWRGWCASEDRQLTHAAGPSVRSRDRARLFPSRPSEIDLAGAGECTGAGTDGAADQRTFERGTHESAADETDAGTDSAAGESAIPGAMAAAGKGEKRQADCKRY